MKDLILQIWQFISEHQADFIIGFIITIIVTIVIVLFRNLLRRLWRAIFGTSEEKKEQNRKLRAHFKELSKEAQSAISSACGAGNEYGRVKFGTSQISDSFKAHFSEESKEWTEWQGKASEHNGKYEEFCQKIKKAFESKGILVKSHLQSQANTCIFSNVLNPLFVWWTELAVSKRPWVDFQKLDWEPVNSGYQVYPSGWKSSAAAFATEDEQEKCESALAEVAKDKENQGEATKLNNSGNELVEQAKSFADQFASKLNDIDTFWPPKKPNEFKKLKKNCPRCRELF